MRKNNKQFVRNVIITSVIGLSTLMIVLFVVLQTYLEKHEEQTYIEAQIENEVISTAIELSENRIILIEKITQDEIVGYDIKNKSTFNKSISDTARVNDAYGNVMPITQIKVGDIVEVDYQNGKDSVVAVGKSVDVQSFKKISGVTVDKTTQQIKIGGTNYAYTDETMVLNADGSASDIGKIGPFDIVNIQELDDIVWSITIDKASASINMVDLPTQNGQIEIDNSRLIQFKDITEPIKIIPGEHKIVIKMEGYVTITDQLSMSSGQVYEMSLGNAEIAYTTVSPYISAKISDYIIKIDGNSYGPGDEIKLQQGNYEVEVIADGYEKWVRQVNLSKDVYKLSVALIPIEEESLEENTNTTSTNEALNNSRTIVLNTSPSGAKVYINGAYSGETPYTVTLNNGSYNMLFEKTGYMVYSTTILLDNSNDQNAFLYILNVPE